MISRGAERVTPGDVPSEGVLARAPNFAQGIEESIQREVRGRIFGRWSWLWAGAILPLAVVAWSDRANGDRNRNGKSGPGDHRG